jgi:hypothetical protein
MPAHRALAIAKRNSSEDWPGKMARGEKKQDATTRNIARRGYAIC